MVINRYEYSSIRNEKLPDEWKSQTALDELEDFLQQNWEQRAVFYDDDEVMSTQQFLKFISHQAIKTNKYIGTIVFKGQQLNIFPRVFKYDKDDDDLSELSQKHLMRNLVIWLDYCNKQEYPFINMSTELTDSEDLRELFITLYIGYLNSAIERGLYYNYVDETEDIRCIKGKFDIKDYITRKIPNGNTDSFRCTYSKFEFDNKVNRIIKFTCKQIFNSTSRKNQRKLRTILTRLDEVSDVVCVPSDCDGIRLSKMHKHYSVIVSMSKMFLLNRMSNYTVDKQESFCFLFPTELLFEGFIGGYLKQVMTSEGAKVFLQKSDVSLVDDVQYDGRSYGAAFTMRHDILVEYEGKVVVLDTKYKEVERFADREDDINVMISKEIKQEDMNQICEYARKRAASDVYLLYPLYRREDDEPKAPPKAISQADSGDVTVHYVRLPFVFEEDNEDNIKRRLRKIIIDIFNEAFA